MNICAFFLVLHLVPPGCGPVLTPPPPPPPSSEWSMFLSGPQDGSIYVVRGGSKTLLPITGTSPSWMPDGRIVYVRGGQLHTANHDGTGYGAVGPSGLGAVAPTAARDGTIAFMGERGGVYLLKPDGTLKVLFPPASGQPGAPSYMQPFIAPSGTWLAYVMQTENPYHREVWRVNVDGSGQRALATWVDDPLRPDANAPAISPDETWVALFSGKEAPEMPGPPSVLGIGHRDVAVVHAGGGGGRRLLTNCTPVDTQAEMDALAADVCVLADNPAWAPDGGTLVFDMLLKSGSVTGIVNFDGTGRRIYYTSVRGVERNPLSR